MSVNRMGLTVDYAEQKRILELNFLMFQKNYDEVIGKIESYKLPEVYDSLLKTNDLTNLTNYIVEVSRLFINFVSMARAVVEIWSNSLSDRHKGEFKTYKDLLQENEDLNFLDALRDVILHFRILDVNAKLLCYPPEPGGYEELGFVIPLKKLNGYNWKRRDKSGLIQKYLKKQGDSIQLEGLIKTNYKIIREYYQGLLSILENNN